jgi:hypothetical protein
MLGYHVVEHTVPWGRCGPPTFASWLRNKRPEPALWLVLITGHFAAVNGDWFCDTRFRKPIELSKLIRKPYARSRVRQVWRIEPIHIGTVSTDTTEEIMICDYDEELI